jgi:hypothetical protein
MDAPLSVLQWDRGALEAECDRAATVRAGVEAYLGRSVFGDEGPLLVRVRLSRTKENGRTRVVAKVTQETRDGRAWGEREVVGDASCASLDEPLTLVVALLVDAPAADAKPERHEVTPPPKPPEPSEPAENPPPAPEMRPIETTPGLEHERAPGHVVLLALGLVSMGGLPSTAVGGGLWASVKPRGFWGLGLEGGAWLPQRIALGSGSLETSLFVVSGSLCPLQGVNEGAWWSACGSIGAARLHARSRHLLGARSRSDWFALPGVTARGGWLVGHGLLVSGGLAALFPVAADYYVYRSPEGEKQLAFEPSALVITAQLGLGLLLD